MHFPKCQRESLTVSRWVEGGVTDGRRMKNEVFRTPGGMVLMGVIKRGVIF